MNRLPLIIVILAIAAGGLWYNNHQSTTIENKWVSHDIPFMVPCPDNHAVACSPPPNFQRSLPDGSPNLEYMVEDSILIIYADGPHGEPYGPITAYEFKNCTMAFIENFKDKNYQHGRPVTGPQEFGYNLDFRSEWEKHHYTNPEIKWPEPKQVPCQ